MNSKLIDMYTKNLYINGNSISDIIKFDDVEFKNNIKYIYWFFPQINKISEREKYILLTDKKIRNRIVKLVNRVLMYVEKTGSRSLDKLVERIRIFLNYIQLLQNKKNSVKRLRGLCYKNNSCYMDSVLMCLFLSPNKIIDKNILEKNVSSISGSTKKWIECDSDKRTDLLYRKQIQNELCKIANSIRGEDNVKDCSELRKCLSYCKGSQEFHEGGMQDAGEFLLYLFNIFEVNLMKKSRITYVSNSLSNPPKNYIKTFEEVQTSTPLISINSHDLKGGVNVIDFLQQTDDALFEKEDFYRDETGQRYRRRIENIKVISSPYIVFNIQRVGYNRVGREVYLNIGVEFPENIVLGEMFLKLHSVVVHNNMHYTCYIKYDKNWYYYDDIREPVIRYVGNIPEEVKKNCTLLFYTI